GGVSGDMFVAALLDLGLPLDRLRAELKKIPTLQFDIRSRKKTIHSLRASQFQVICPKHEAPRSWKQIRDLIKRSKLDPRIKSTSSEIFAALATAEAKIHGVPIDQVHFHEVGATDSIVDIVAAAVGVRELAIEAFYFSVIPLGHGMISSAHGLLPAPGPATLELLRGLPVMGIDVDTETVTPTGAAIVRTLGKQFASQPAMTIEKIGYGAGKREFAEHPNLFRIILGRADSSASLEEMLVIETNIDDMNPQLFDHVMDRLFAAGARDVFLAPIQMKKNRPATLLSVIAEPPDRQKLSEIIFKETSTLGLRYHLVSRMILKREMKKVKTRFGEVTVKIIEQLDGSRRAVPEYDDLKRIARAKNIPLKLLHDEVARKLGA
ncbi:MAG TPA: nickel pincer cofactor biosynthesis protein LarC, partial [Candidatus Binatia bacterium]|nr:nickel pincer cofactor biosynthesis protein LarC [Candidatus Binatia bacterium]